MALLVFPRRGDPRILNPNTLLGALNAAKKLGLRLEATVLPWRLRIVGTDGSSPDETLLQALELQGFEIER